MENLTELSSGRGIIVFEGNKGSGMTLSAIAMTLLYSKLFKKPIRFDYSLFGQPYKFLTRGEFLSEMERLNVKS